MKKYVLIYSKNGEDGYNRRVENRNARFWLQQTGADKVWIYTANGVFIAHAIRYADGVEVTTNSDFNTISDYTRKRVFYNVYNI